MFCLEKTQISSQTSSEILFQMKNKHIVRAIVFSRVDSISFSSFLYEVQSFVHHVHVKRFPSVPLFDSCYVYVVYISLICIFFFDDQWDSTLFYLVVISLDLNLLICWRKGKDVKEIFNVCLNDNKEINEYLMSYLCCLCTLWK